MEDDSKGAAKMTPPARPDAAQAPTRTGGAPMVVGYVMNSYPIVSTTFIGREIAGLEAAGVEVRRYAIRTWDGPLVDSGDLHEREITQYLLTGSRRRLIGSALACLLGNPRGSLAAMAMVWRLYRADGHGIVRHVAYLLEAMVLVRLLLRDKVQHVHAHFATNSAAIAMLAEVMGGPGFSFTIHGPDELFTPHHISLKRKIEKARFVACISHFCRAQAMYFSEQSDWDKLRIVHCGVRPANYGRAGERRGGKDVLFVGRLDAVKGVPLLLEAFARVARDHPDARLRIVGDGPHRDRLTRQAAALGLPAEVFLGYRPQAEVAALLDTADMLVLPSFAEGVPVVLMEAMAARIPVIAPRVAGVAELVEDGVSGYVVPPGDVDSLAERLGTLLGDPALQRRMGEAGRRTVEAGFDTDAEAGWMAALISGAIAGRLPAGLRPAAPDETGDAPRNGSGDDTSAPQPALRPQQVAR